MGGWGWGVETKKSVGVSHFSFLSFRQSPRVERELSGRAAGSPPFPRRLPPPIFCSTCCRLLAKRLLSAPGLLSVIVFCACAEPPLISRSLSQLLWPFEAEVGGGGGVEGDCVCVCVCVCVCPRADITRTDILICMLFIS